jgi:acetyl esterase/lipase
MNPKHGLPKLVAFSLLAFSLMAGCGGRTSGGDAPYAKQTYTYKVVDSHEIRADVYRLPGNGIRPAIIWLHPGALIVGSREWLASEQMATYLDAGYVVIAVDYRLAPETKLDEIVGDVEDAYAWVRTEGPELFQIDPDRVAVVGHSAGGYLALTAGHRLEPRPRALVSFYGYGDVTGTWIAEPDPTYLDRPVVSRDEAFAAIGDSVISDTEVERSTDSRYPLYIHCRQQGSWPVVVSGHDPETDQQWFREYEPMLNVTPRYPPTMLIHGEADDDVPYERSVLVANELERHGVEHEFLTDPAWGHMFDAAEPDSRAVQQLFAQILTFLERHL